MTDPARLSAPSASPDATTTRARRRLRLALRVAAIALAAVVVLAIALLAWAWSELRGSRPRLEGDIAVAALGAPVTVARDTLGVPDVRAASRRDAAAALGFLHAQERFFQMDLQRRQPAGELAALAGRALARDDSLMRLHQFRRRAARAVAGASPGERDLLAAYAGGVNAGLRALRRPPWEYRLLRARPEPWREEDCFLVLFSMFVQLNEESETALRTLHATLPRPLAEFLAPQGTEWDAPLDGSAPVAAPPPGPEAVDLRVSRPAGAPLAAAVTHDSDAPLPGSNNWAVAGSRTRDGRAIVANDMHLGLSVPNIWYRAALAWPETAQAGVAHERRVCGVTLPGVPALVAGSNGDVAWGFTNAYGDFIDLVIVTPDPADSTRYFAPGGPLAFGREREVIAVHGSPADTIEVLTTIWGPVVRRDHLGSALAMRWTAHDSAAVNVGLLALESARSVNDALALAPRCGIPPQNLIVADRDGRIGWTIIGRVPRRVGWDGRLPASWADGACRWDGWLEGAEVPRVADPPAGQLWTANARAVGGEALARLGDGGYGLGARARQIRDDLAALDAATERDLLAIQLDDRALLLERWRGLLLATLGRAQAGAGAAARDTLRGPAHALADTGWSGRASTASAGYRLVRAFRSAAWEVVLGGLAAPCRAADPRFDLGQLTQWEGPLWALATQRPPHLLPPPFATWDEALLAAADSAIARLARGGLPLAARTWGERNTLRMRHPLSPALASVAPAVTRRLVSRLDMPRRPLPGDSHLPRVQSPTSGASERFVVSPGREADGIFHMPGGQAGHPLAPYWGGGHGAWAEGEPAPFLPGPPAWTLRLVPSR